MRILFTTIAIVAAFPAGASSPLLDDAVNFTGQIFHLDSGVPGMVIAAVRGDESAVFGFGEITKGSDREPDGATQIGIGSITKTFTGLSLAHTIAAGHASLSEPAAPHVGIVEALPERDGHQIRLIDLATHASGLPRELAPFDDVEKYSDGSFAANLAADPLMFPPGTGISYSNIAFDLLGMALSGIHGQSYPKVLKENVLDPIGLTSTGYPRPQGDNVMTGYDWNGEAMDPGEAIPNRAGASALHSTANDMIKYLQWNLDRFGEEGADARAIAQAAWAMRDGLDPVFGMDESGHMDAMGLGWVIMMPDGDRPLILQKAGGTDGMLSYIAFAPSRGVGVFISINQFNFSAGAEMAQVANDLIANLAPR